MRSLINWARRRLMRNIALGAVASAAPLAIILLWPMPSWEPVALVNGDELPARPVACEVVDRKLWAAAWYERAGEGSGPAAYFETSADVVASPIVDRPPTQRFTLPKRALPASMLDPDVTARVQRLVRGSGVTGNDGDARIALPRKDRFVYIQPAVRRQPSTQDLQFQALDRLPIPETDGTVIVVHQDGRPPRVSTVPSLSPPVWRDYQVPGQPHTSPARAMSVIWEDDGNIWLGVAGERDITGGLWHSADAGGSWQKVDGFVSVTSLHLRRASGGGRGTLVVAEQSFKRLNETGFVSGASRVVERTPDGSWTAALAPPFSTSSEIELCGALPDGSNYVRVDGQILRQGSEPLFRTIVGRRGSD